MVEIIAGLPRIEPELPTGTVTEPHQPGKDARALICWSGSRSLAVGAFFVLLFLPDDNDNLGLELPVGVDRCSAVTPPAADVDVFVKLELWVGHLISSLLPNTGFLRSPQT